MSLIVSMYMCEKISADLLSEFPLWQDDVGEEQVEDAGEDATGKESLGDPGGTTCPIFLIYWRQCVCFVSSSLGGEKHIYKGILVEGGIGGDMGGGFLVVFFVDFPVIFGGSLVF